MDGGQFDLIVVGAGPAGCAAAIAALRARPTARVLLLDREALGRDKVCGDGIAPHAVAALRALGVTDAVLPTEIVPAVELVAPGGGSNAAVTATPGYVVPRRVFDERLARAAIAAGAVFVRERVTTLSQDAPPGRAGADARVVVNGRWSAPVVVAADGSNSVVRRLVGEPANAGPDLAVAVRGYAQTPVGHPLQLTLRWDSQRAGGLCYAWAFPVSDGTSNVGYGMSAAAGATRARLESRARALLPEFDLDGVALRGHTLPLSVRRPRAFVGRVLLTGDAASLINPFTGEGIYSAIASGALAGEAAVTSSPSGATAGAVYARALSARFGAQHRQMRALYPLINVRRVLDTVVRACGSDPLAFERLLDVGLGDARFRVSDLARFGRWAFAGRGSASAASADPTADPAAGPTADPAAPR